MDCGFCFGCMEQISSYPCPHCGYRPDPESLPYALQPGTILKGKYLVGKVLGQGGFGITYMGMDLQLLRKVAIKEYYPASFVCRKDASGTVWWNSNELAQEAKMSGQDMFLKEARKMGKVNHIPEVVHIYDLFQENNTAYICMGFIDGVTLKEYLKAKGPLSWPEARKLFLPVVAAMEQVHKAGLVHRDISPDNIMLRSDGSVRILDLGAAKDLNINSGKSSMKVAKNGFSPLEQYLQSGNSGSWTDVYSVAATLYYTLTGKLPLPAMDRMAPEGDALEWDHPQLQALPQAVQNAIKQAMVLKTSDRTQTMGEFARQLWGEPAKPVPKPVSKPVPKADPKPVAKAVSKPEKPANKKPVEKKPEDKKPDRKPIGALIAVAVVLLVVGIFLVKPMLTGDPNGAEETIPAQTTEGAPVSDEAVPCETLYVISGTEVKLTVGESHQIDVTAKPSNTTDEVTYDSSDTAVATVSSSGKITAVAAGEATITIRCGTLQKTVSVVCSVSETDATEDDVAEFEDDGMQVVKEKKPTMPSKKPDEGTEPPVGGDDPFAVPSAPAYPGIY